MEFWFNFLLITIILFALTYWVYQKTTNTVDWSTIGGKRVFNPSSTEIYNRRWHQIIQTPTKQHFLPVLDVVFANKLPRDYPLVKRYSESESKSESESESDIENESESE